MDKAYARETDPQTSHDAADSISEQAISLQKTAVLDYLRRFGPATLDRITRDMSRAYPEKHWSEQSIRSRTKELRDLGKAEIVGTVQETGKRTRVMIVGAVQ